MRSYFIDACSDGIADTCFLFLHKHCYMFIALDKSGVSSKYFIYFSIKNLCCGYSLEAL